MANNDRGLYRRNLAPRLLDDRPSLAQGLDEPACGAVEPGWFRGIQLDKAIVDAQAGQCGQDVFHQSDLSGRLTERRSPLCACHHVHSGGDMNARPKIGAHENDPGGWRGRQESKSNHRASEKAQSVDFRRVTDGPLPTFAEPSHWSSL